MPWSQQTFNQLIIEGTNAGMFIYNGTPGLGTLIGSWASVAGVDSFGNAYPVGINVIQGSLSSVTMTHAVVMASTIASTLISASQISSSSITGGTMNQTVITFNSTGGGLFLYTTTTSTTTYTTSQNITAPSSSVLSMNVQCWGGDAGAGGGNATNGGEAGGGAEYAQEPAYPNYSPGGTYAVQIGSGGSGATTGSAGTSGQQTSFDTTGVIAGGGLAGSGGTGGIGGNISTATVHYPGGNGGNVPSGVTASAGGGGRAGSTGAGGNGGNAATGVPGAAGAAGTGTGGIAGGAGVLAANNGNNGGGGSGAGAAAGATQLTKQYRPIATYSYYGAGVGNGRRNVNGSMFQGDPNVNVDTSPGDQYSFAYYGDGGAGTPGGDFASYTINSVTVEIENAHSWYASGCYLIWGYSNFNSFGTTGNLSGATENVQTNWINQGADAVFDLTSAYGSLIELGLWSSILLGPSSSTAGGSYDLYNYGYFNGGPTLGPLLTIKGSIGAGNQTAGSGSNGKVIVSYQSSNVIVGALSPIAGTDAGGNTYGAGYTGQVQAFTPGSNPATVETWHSFPLNTSVFTVRSGYDSRYRLTADNKLEVEVSATCSTSGSQTFCTALPVGYRPLKPKDCLVGTSSSSVVSNGGVPSAEINTSGVITIYNMVATTTLVQLYARFSLD